MAIKFLNTVAVDTDVLYVDASSNRVGIGTTSPSRKLHIHADSGNAYLQLTQAATGTTSNDGFQISMGTGQVNFINRENGNMVFETNNTERMRIANTGSVGIATTSPDYKLEVNGTLGVSRTDGIIFAGSAGSGLGNKITSDTSNNLIFSTSLPSAPYTTTEKARITNAGDVGIGTASPTSFGTGSRLITVQAASGGGYGGLLAKTDSVTGQIWANEGGPNVFIGTRTNHPLILTTNNTEKARIDTSGKVGIGTTAPSEKLHVNGNIRTNSTQGYYGSFLQAISSTGLKIGNDDFSGYAFFNNNGNTGIGTESPSTKLHIGPTVSGSTVEEFRIQTGTSSGYGGTAIINLLTGQYGNSGIYFGDSSQGYSNQPAFIEFQDSPSTLIYKAPATSGSHIFKIGTAEKMRINYNGKVGVNTTNPLAQFHVDGETYFRDNFFVAKSGTIGTSNTIEVKVAGTSNGDAQIRIGDVNDYWGGTNSYSTWNTTDRTLVHGLDVGINCDPKNMLHIFKGNLYLDNSGLRDSNGDYGVAGQNLKSKGQGTVEYSWEKMTLTSVFYASSFQSGSVIYMPFGVTSETTTNQYYNNFVAPYNGRVRQIRIKHISGSTPTATSFSSFRVYVNGSLTGNVTPTTTSGGSNGMMGVAEYSDTAATFNAGDRVQFAYVASGSTGHIYGATATFIIEYTENK